MNIEKIDVFSILDSRGWPTLAGSLMLEDGKKVYASVPSGSSVGKYEAVEKRDADKDNYSGQSVEGVVLSFKDKIIPVLLGQKPDLERIDKELIELDGTGNKSNLGANVTLLASVLVAKAQALTLNVEVFEFIAHVAGFKPAMPLVRANVINGGKHADSGLAFQEFMIQMLPGTSFEDQQHSIVSLYHKLAEALQLQSLSACVGDEGGFAPRFGDKGMFGNERAALTLLSEVVECAGMAGKVNICLDVAASEFYDEKYKTYNVYGEHVFAEDLIQFYSDLVSQYPIVSIEDGLVQDDWEGWQSLTEKLGKNVQIVADDLCVTKTTRIQKAIEENACNAFLIKPNQVGTVSETLAAITLAKSSGCGVVPSHRSGETNDSFIADFAIGIAADACK
ncbi:phosphopyruvate hydratase, partial [Candidatus Babeliales bacterium]|nr:phosphopyruvate hydratase [Candidatus Babeliales bacterium]